MGWVESEYRMGEALLSLKDAAHHASVDVPVIRNWIKRGYRARDGSWRHLPALWNVDGTWSVHPVDLAIVEAATRERARRDALSG